MTVKLGMFAMPIHHPDKDYRALLREDQEAVILADKLGFSEFYMGEHHTSLLERVTNPLLFLASVADRTKTIRLGTGVMNLPQMHPVAVASNVAMFDHMCDGRFIMGIGPGSLISDVEAFSLTQADVRSKMMLESIDMVQKLWANEPPFELKGDYWNVALKDGLWPDYKVGWMPKPLQPDLPVAVALVTPKSSTAKVAGGKGWIAMSSNFIHKRYMREHWESYAEGAVAAGLKPDRDKWRVVRCCLVTESQQETDDYLATPDTSLDYYYQFFRFNLSKGRGALFMLKPDLAMSDEETTVNSIVRSQVIAGSPKRVLEQLVALREEIGHFGTLIMTSHDWDKPKMWQRSMELMATEVMPKFSKHAAEKVAA